MGQIIDGKAVSAKVKEEIRLETEKLKDCLLYTSPSPRDCS
mgnify:CR=1 FL=1